MFLRKGGISRRGDEKRREGRGGGGTDTPFRTMNMF